MAGKCRPSGIGVLDVGNVLISFNLRQIWQFKFGIINGKNVVKISRDNVRLYWDKEDFDKDWEIVKEGNNEV
jgi:hypothetical protein